MSKSRPKVSLIIPAYNEADRIAASLKEVARFISSQDDSYEILLINDGSRDKTAEIVRDTAPNLFAEGSFQILEYGENRGKGYAVRYGIERAQGDFIVFSDTDLSAPIDQIPKLIRCLETGSDVAIGSRRLPESEVVGLSHV